MHLEFPDCRNDLPNLVCLRILNVHSWVSWQRRAVAPVAGAGSPWIDEVLAALATQSPERRIAGTAMEKKKAAIRSSVAANHS